jgi:hypothetical protein
LDPAGTGNSPGDPVFLFPAALYFARRLIQDFLFNPGTGNAGCFHSLLQDGLI